MMNTEEMLQIIQAFQKLPTGNISDAMDELGFKRSVVPGLHRISGGTATAAGFALTIRQAQRNVSAVPGENLTRHGKVIDEDVQPGNLIVIDTGGVTEVSTGGSIQMLIAKSHGATGYLTNGCLRDVDEIAEIGLPVHCAGSTPVKSALDLETVGVNVPVVIDGVQICSGDFVVMDQTGILVIPPEHLQEVLAKAQAIQQREEQMLALLREGHSLVEARTLVKKESKA